MGKQKQVFPGLLEEIPRTEQSLGVPCKGLAKKRLGCRVGLIPGCPWREVLKEYSGSGTKDETSCTFIFYSPLSSLWDEDICIIYRGLRPEKLYTQLKWSKSWVRPVKSRRQEGCSGVLTDTRKDRDVKSCWLVPHSVKTVLGNSLDTWLLKRALEPGSGDFSCHL